MKEVNVDNYISFFVKRFTSKKGNEVTALYVRFDGEYEQLVCYLSKDFDFEKFN